ncbi:MAG TPA: hypothetical protein VHY37_01675 [Tepidisphaeraceae bacterium]|jgi:hypothetical protein|nr:hypothetical protein [Tepidisphaeraceae bacterium]
MRPEVVINIGIAIAAMVLSAGWICILWRRDGQRFALMQMALEKGVTRFPNTPPFWLLSLRQGVTVLALGVALVGVGAGALLVVKNVPEPTPQQQMQALPGQRQDQMRQEGPPGGPDSAQDQIMRPDEPFPAPPEAGGPPGPRGQGGADRRQPPPPPLAVPAVENWHRAQATRTIGLLSLACGAVLLVLGIVRIAFAFVERIAADETRG